MVEAVRERWSRIAAALLATLVLWSPKLATACAVCMAGRDDETRDAFIVTTAGMTFLPLLLIFGVVWWLRRQFVKRALEEAAAEAVSVRATVVQRPIRASRSADRRTLPASSRSGSLTRSKLRGSL